MIFLPKRVLAFTTIFTFLSLPISHRAFAADPIEPVDPVRRQIDEAVARVKPALVRIKVVATQYYQGREVKFEASGSGVIISKEGHVITNHHVAGHATRIVVILPSNEEIPADLVGTDPLADISVLKLKPDAKREFPTVDFGDSDAMRVGDSVLAMGSPLAMSQSVTLGIVSNVKMVMPGSVLVLAVHAGRRGCRLPRPLDRPRRRHLSRQLGRPARQPERPGHRYQRDQLRPQRRHPR